MPDNIQSVLDLLRCPLCRGAFIAEGSSLLCEHGHCFDSNKRGYVNLVPSQRPTKYGEDIFLARSRIFEAGAYEPVAAALNETVGDGCVLDAGCGEGFFLSAIQSGAPKLGVDLSKEAIAIAAKRDRGVAWMAADLARLPVRDGAVDVLINILSPANYPEFGRVLNREGLLVKLVPNADYLRELRSVSNKAAYSNEEVVALFRNNVSEFSYLDIDYSVKVSREMKEDFLKMTPLTSFSDLRQENGEIESVTISLRMLSGRKKVSG
ncbi:MAG: methyltransferase domain-containing protein [Clostridia bacterium]|nr:methyltransferase domain-containing protein [Clostridia bacterium]